MKSIIMKNLLALVSILLSASVALADSLYIDPFEITIGETKDVAVCLSNSQEITALQADIILPPGLELIKQGDDWLTLTDRASSDHNIVVNKSDSGLLKIVCFSNSNVPFSGFDGSIINLKIRANEDFYGGVIVLTNIKLSDSSNKDLIIDDCNCYVTPIVLPDSVILDLESVELKVGQSIMVGAWVLPDNATDKTIIWSSDNEAVATVDINGSVTAVSIGTATIKASCGNCSASCVVSVIETPVERVVLSQTEAQLKVSESFILTAYVYPEDATDKTVTWASDNEAIATVDANGNVTAVSIGSAIITATSGNYSDSCVVTVVATPVERVVLSQTEAQLKVSESFILTAYVYPEDATDKTVTWASDNEAIATVDANGNVTAVSIGSAIITATSGNYSDTCVVTVVATPVERVVLSQTEAQLKVSESFILTAYVYPEDATDKTVTWTSDNEAIATVDANGNVTAVSIGSAIITATSGNYSDTCVVTVVATPVESILFSMDTWIGEEGESFRIEATVLPEDATDKNLQWSSSDESIATVDAEGNVSVLKEGSCVIKATAADGSGIFAECIITSTSGVDGIFSDSESFDIFGLNGILIKKYADRDDLKNLTPGIYIIRCGAEIKKLIIR